MAISALTCDNKKMNNLFSVKNKIVLISGSSSDMANPLCKYLIQNGAQLILIDKHDLNRKSRNFFKCDLAQKRKILNLCKIIKKKYKKIDAIVNFVGISDPKNFEKNFNVNTFSIYYLIYGLLKLLKFNEVSIVNITSLNSELGFTNNPGYNSSKGALKSLTKSLATDLAKFNIRVNNIGPGYIKTKMTRKSFLNKKEKNKRLSRMLIKRYGEPEEIVGAVIFLITKASSYVTGQDFYIDGGFLAKGI